MIRRRVFVQLLLVTTALFTASASPQEIRPGRERIPGAEALTAQVEGPGYPLKIFITRPQQSTGKLPVILVVGWLSCDSVEATNGPAGDGFAQLVFDMAGRSGFATFRMEKP